MFTLNPDLTIQAISNINDEGTYFPRLPHNNYIVKVIRKDQGQNGITFFMDKELKLRTEAIGVFDIDYIKPHSDAWDDCYRIQHQGGSGLEFYDNDSLTEELAQACQLNYERIINREL